MNRYTLHIGGETFWAGYLLSGQNTFWLGFWAKPGMRALPKK